MLIPKKINETNIIDGVISVLGFSVGYTNKSASKLFFKEKTPFARRW